MVVTYTRPDRAEDHARQIGSRVLTHAGVDPFRVLLGGVAPDGYVSYVEDPRHPGRPLFNKARGEFVLRHVRRPRGVPSATWLLAVAASRTINRLLNEERARRREIALRDREDAEQRLAGLRPLPTRVPRLRKSR